jgi:hypothetical protein
MGFFGDVANVVTGKKDAKAARKAGQVQTQAAEDGVDLTSRMYDEQKQALQPYANAGPVGLYGMGQIAQNYDNSAARLQGIEGRDYMDIPGFGSASNVMARQVGANNAARGKLGSGNTLMDLFRENANLGESMKSNMYNRALTTENYKQNLTSNAFNRMSTLADTGINALNNQTILGTNAVSNINNLRGGGAAAQAAGIIGSQNAKNAGMNNLIQLGTMAAGAYNGSGGYGGYNPTQVASPRTLSGGTPGSQAGGGLIADFNF